MKLFISALVCLVIAIPASAATSTSKKEKALERVRYVEYSGKQQDWPTSNGPMIEIEHTKYGAPVYHNLPNKPYEVLGSIQSAGNSAIKHAVEAAQAVGADAILVVKDKVFTDAGIDVTPDASSRGSGQGKIKLLEGILIRWKRQ